MDKDAIAASFRYQQMRQQHYNGGYFSDAVNQQAELFATLNEQEQHEFFRDTFNLAHKTAQKVQAHPRFNGEDNDINLSPEGFGVITVGIAENTAEEIRELGGDESNPYVGLLVFVDSFAPNPEGGEIPPRDWQDYVYADPDGNFHDSHGYWKINEEIKRLLGMKETLDLVTQVLEIA